MDKIPAYEDKGMPTSQTAGLVRESSQGGGKRIAFVTNFIPPYRKTFYEKLCSNTTYEWLVIHGSTSTDAGRPEFEGRIDFPHLEVENKQRLIGPFCLRWQSGVVQRVRKYNPDFLIVLGISGTLTNWILLLWATLRKKKRLIWSSGWEPQSEGSKAFHFKRFLLRFYLSLADTHLVYSTNAARYLIDIGVPQNKVIVCYNGLEIDHLLATEQEIRLSGKLLRQREQIGSDTLFLYVGGMLEEKKVDLLLRTFVKLKNEDETSRLWFVGDGPQKSSLEKLARENGLQDVKFWGRVVDEVDCFFTAADFFVLPGTGGLALNQALFWGVPCVVGHADGTEDDLVIDGVTGVRFIPEDQSSLLEALRNCKKMDVEQRARLGKEGRRLVESRSNVSEMVQTFITALQGLDHVT